LFLQLLRRNDGISYFIIPLYSIFIVFNFSFRKLSVIVFVVRDFFLGYLQKIIFGI
jgi:hypothetical protein